MTIFSKYPLIIILSLVALMVTSSGVNVFVKHEPISQNQFTSELNVKIIEIGQSELNLLQPISETPLPTYFLNSSRMFTILYLNMNFMGTTTVDGIQMIGQPTIIMDGVVYPIRSRYNKFRMFLTLTQGTHIISLVNMGISSSAGLYVPIFSHTSFIVQVGSYFETISLSSFQTAYQLNATYDPNQGFNSNLAHLDKAFIQPSVIDGNYTVFNATLEGTGFVGYLPANDSFTPIPSAIFLQTADGIRNISTSGIEETKSFGENIPIANFISMYPIGFDSPPYSGNPNMTFFGADVVSFRGQTNGSVVSVTETTPTTSATIPEEPSTPSSLNLELPIVFGSVIMALVLLIRRNKK